MFLKSQSHNPRAGSAAKQQSAQQRAEGEEHRSTNRSVWQCTAAAVSALIKKAPQRASHSPSTGTCHGRTKAAELMPGRAESKGSKTPTRAHTIAEFDAWRSRQEVAAKSRSSRAQGGVAAPASAAAGGGGGAPYHNRRRTSAGGSGGAAAAKMPLLPLTKV